MRRCCGSPAASTGPSGRRCVAHPRLSARLLQRFEFVSPQAQAVELHHERMDGRGYYGVGGDDLPLASHFLIVADSFDAMTTDRPYRAGLSHEAALMEIERNAGTQFHPAVAKAFVAVQRGVDPDRRALARRSWRRLARRVRALPDRCSPVPRAEGAAGADRARRRRRSVLPAWASTQDWLDGGRRRHRRRRGRRSALIRHVGPNGQQRRSIALSAQARSAERRLRARLRTMSRAPGTTTGSALMAWDDDGLGGSMEHSRGTTGARRRRH